MTPHSTDDRRYPARPIVGVGAVIIDGDSVLLVERAKPPLLGWWSLPGGAVDSGERLEDAIRREVREETGLEVTLHGILEVVERITPDPDGRAEYHYVLIDFLCTVSGGSLAAGDDAGRARWVRRADLTAYRITEGAIPVIEKAFARANSLSL